jgi:hypothetical protein
MSRPGPPPPPAPPRPPSSDFLINSTISRDWSLKSMGNSLQAFVPNERDSSMARRVFRLEPKAGGRSRSHRRGSSSSMSSDPSDGSASMTARPKRNAGLEVNAKRRLKNELEDEARLGSTPQLDIDSNTQSLDGDASEGPTSGKSKAKHTASNHIFTCPNSWPTRL